MKNKKPTVTIGIPAYNEEANIGNLLKALLSQKQINYKLKEIIVISDCSSDKTGKMVRSIRSKKIRLFVNEKRLGKSLTQNRILKKFSSDYLVLFDADVLPKNKSVVDKIIDPFFQNPRIGLVGGKVIPIKPKNILEKTLFFSRKVKMDLFEEINGGNNIYLCHGALRALTAEFAKKIKWPAISGEDAYTYLKCINLGYLFYYQPNSSVYFKLPHKWKGHFSQSVRFLGSRKRLKRYFGEQLVDESFAIPANLLVKKIFPPVMREPLFSVLYLLIFVYANLMKLFVDKSMAKWEISLTSKKLGRN